ncbi:hypothetical protein DK846_05355 [Methanospirillum lacunae]|uniref:Uncharacterized protein n=1 Tax=Methanospirillum lacunae TaxID=668570 RepID=A0A2V2NCD7_9EURY|nr:hypothetical protein DK846_05355 [Methanospirillum lacunae]
MDDSKPVFWIETVKGFVEPGENSLLPDMDADMAGEPERNLVSADTGKHTRAAKTTNIRRIPDAFRYSFPPRTPATNS